MRSRVGCAARAAENSVVGDDVGAAAKTQAAVVAARAKINSVAR